MNPSGTKAWVTFGLLVLVVASTILAKKFLIPTSLGASGTRELTHFIILTFAGFVFISFTVNEAVEIVEKLKGEHVPQRQQTFAERITPFVVLAITVFVTLCLLRLVDQWFPVEIEAAPTSVNAGN